eukprot:maker-scaffold18_size714446-snap-gene-2.12 protein:Tk08459 transcript:maker-scaffold18_size714446-snap-gene-2.12-mRNA-1 annotation:"hypothetical protein DAPPUDRAFT_300978"
MQSSTISSDVVVIGAGLAGLVAAREIKRQDPSLEVLVLEANSRLGGRVWSHQVAWSGQSVSVDLGGDAISPQQTELWSLLEELQLPTAQRPSPDRQPLKQLYFCSTHTSPIWRGWALNVSSGFKGWVRRFEWIYVLNRLKSYEDSWHLAKPYRHHKLAQALDMMTLSAFLKRFCYFASNRDMFEMLCLRCFGRASAEISLLYFLLYAKSCGGIHELFSETPPWHIVGGAQTLVDKLADTAGNIITNQAVESVIVNRDQVYITSSTQQMYVCQRVICAISPEQIGHVQFEPTLSLGLRKTVKNWSSGNVIRFVMLYERPFWRDSGFSGSITCLQGKQIVKECSGLPITQVFDKSPSESEQDIGILTGFIGGTAALQWGQVNPEILKQSLIDTLSEYFGQWAHDEKSSIELHYWDQEAFIASPTCTPRSGCLDYIHTLREAHQGKVYFAGADIAIEWIGHMAGAVQSGRRAAFQVLDDLRPQALSTEAYKLLKKEFISPEDKLPKDLLSSRNYGIYRWTLFLPISCIAIGYGACFLRDKWCGIFIPMH